MTPRQELVFAAAQQLKRWRKSGEMKTNRFGARSILSVEDAIVAVLDGYFEPGSMGAKMRTYYEQLSKQAFSRLANEIAKRAR